MSTQVSSYLKKVLPIAFAICLVISVVAALMARPQYGDYTILCRWNAGEGEGRLQEMLEHDVGVLDERLAALGRRFRIRNAAVSTDGEKWIRLNFKCDDDSLDEIIFWLTLPGKVEFFLLHPDPYVSEAYHNDPPEGYEILRYSQYFYNLSRPGELKSREHEYLVSDVSLLQINEFESVEFDTRGMHQTTVLRFRFKTEHAEIFEAVTALNTGRKMVMAIDGRLFFPARRIERGISGGTVEVQGFFYNPPLRKLVDVLDAGGLRGDLEVVEKAECQNGTSTFTFH